MEDPKRTEEDNKPNTLYQTFLVLGRNKFSILMKVRETLCLFIHMELHLMSRNQLSLFCQVDHWVILLVDR